MAKYNWSGPGKVTITNAQGVAPKEETVGTNNGKTKLHVYNNRRTNKGEKRNRLGRSGEKLLRLVKRPSGHATLRQCRINVIASTLMRSCINFDVRINFDGKTRACARACVFSSKFSTTHRLILPELFYSDDQLFSMNNEIIFHDVVCWTFNPTC